MKRLLPVLASLPCWVTSLLAQTTDLPAPPAPRLPGLEAENPEIMNELKNLGSLFEDIGGRLKELPSPAQP